MFEGFETVDRNVDGVRMHARVGGSGPPVLLLHGYPQTSVMWHQVAPVLADRFTVVVPDLRGYGDSAKPAAGTDSAEYGKRAMAADQLGLMRGLGFDRFAAAGHDRGGRVLHRMCIDAPDTVSRAAVVDIVPTRHVFAHADMALGMAYYHWYFLAQAPDLPERLIGADPDYWVRHHLRAWSGSAFPFAEDAVAEYVRCFADRSAIAASCADYRAATGVDLEQDEASYAAGERISCPLLVLWGARGFVGRNYDVLAVWRDYASTVSGAALDSGHFVPEEQPAETARRLAAFFS